MYSCDALFVVSLHPWSSVVYVKLYAVKRGQYAICQKEGTETASKLPYDLSFRYPPLRPCLVDHNVHPPPMPVCVRQSLLLHLAIEK